MHKTYTPPPRVIRRILAATIVIAAMSLGLTTIPAQADTTNLPDHIVNGDFEYPHILPQTPDTTYKKAWAGSPLEAWAMEWASSWTDITPYDSQYLNQSLYQAGDTSTDWTCWEPLAGFNANQFAWNSSQTEQKTGNRIWGYEYKKGAVELQRDADTGNTYAEITAAQAGTYIYQDVSTMPGATYTIKLKHASLNDKAVDKLSVMIGAPGKEQPVEMTRLTSNGNGDKVGETSTVIATKVSNKFDGNKFNDRKHEGQWETYTGKYVIPAGQTVTRFTFKAVQSPDFAHGNLVDDIHFDISYPLHYDLKGGTGTAPQQHN